MEERSNDISLYAARLNGNLDVKSKAIILKELYDSFDHNKFIKTNEQYTVFLQKMIPTFLYLLETVPVGFLMNSYEQQLRGLVLNILNRLEYNKTFASYAPSLLDQLMKTFKVENEENAILIMKILTGIHKQEAVTLADKVPAFVQIIEQFYKNLKLVAQESFGINKAVSAGNGSSSTGANGDLTLESPAFFVTTPAPMSTSGPATITSPQVNDTRMMVPGNRSFRLIKDFPLSLLTLLTVYPAIVPTILPNILNTFMDYLTLEIEPRDLSNNKKQADLKNRTLYCEFIETRIKIISFISFFATKTGFSLLLNPHKEKLPNLIFKLLQSCLPEFTSGRKELLHALRHILASPFNKIFKPHLESLVNLDILVGEGYTSDVVLSLLAYSIGNDFFIKIKDELTSNDLWILVTTYTDILKNPNISSTVYIMCGKFLTNLLDRIGKLPYNESRRLYFLILDSYCRKLHTINKKFASVFRNINLKQTNSKTDLAYFNDKSKNILFEDDGFVLEEIQVDGDSELEIDYIIKKETLYNHIDKDNDVEMEETGTATTKKQEQLKHELSLYDIPSMYPIQFNNTYITENFDETKILFRSLVSSLKSVMSSLKLSNPPPPSADYNVQVWNVLGRLFDFEQVQVMNNLFVETIRGLKYFRKHDSKYISRDYINQQKKFDFRQPNFPITPSSEEEAIMDQVTTMFSKIDMSTFNEIMNKQILFLVDEIVAYAPLIHLPRYFLTLITTNSNFLGVLFFYLKTNLHLLENSDVHFSHIFLRLFKCCLLSLTQSEENDGVIAIHVKDLVLKSFELSTTSKDPKVYYYLIRTLFKNLSIGNFSRIRIELYPLLDNILISMNSLIDFARTSDEREMYVELCLFLPGGIEHNTEFLQYLMKPLKYSLKGSSDLITLGLKFFLKLVEEVTYHEFEAFLEPYLLDIMKSLWSLLKPVPYNYQHSHTAMQILGKIGGKNRKFISSQTDLELVVPLEQRVEALFKINDIGTKQAMSITTGVSLAIDILEDAAVPLKFDPKLQTYYKIQAYKYLSSVFKLFLGDTSLPDGYLQMIKNGVEVLVSSSPIKDEGFIESLDDISDRLKFDNELELSEEILNGIFAAVAVPELEEEVSAFLKGIVNHFIQLYIIKHIKKKIISDRPLNVDDNEGKLYLNDHVILNCIIKNLSSSIEEIKNLSIDLIKQIVNVSTLFFGSLDKSSSFLLNRSLISILFHSCYDEFYYIRYAGVLGLKVLIEDLKVPTSWYFRFTYDLVRALIFVLQDTPDFISSRAVEDASQLIKHIVSNCTLETQEIVDIEHKLISDLVYDLTNANRKTREIAQESLKIIAEKKKVELVKIIEPCRSILLVAVFEKPLRVLSVVKQIGNVEAITFWFSIAKQENFSIPEIKRLLEEVLSTLESEDKMLAEAKPRLLSSKEEVDYKTKQKLVELRIACIELLKIVITKDEQHSMRFNILLVLFKSLCFSDFKTIDCSYQGLKRIINVNEKLPKHLLQSGLKPMLLNLSDYRKLGASNLYALEKLLVLLSDYFKVEIGSKLIEHLKSWADPQTLHVLSTHDLNGSTIIETVCAIFNIFHLLPARANVYTVPLIGVLDKLEFDLRRVVSSPFRKSLVGFFNRFPEDCFKYYLEKFNTKQNTFIYFIENCAELRKFTVKEISKLEIILKSTSSKDFNTRAVVFINVISTIYALDKKDEAFIKTQSQFILMLFEQFKDILNQYFDDRTNKLYQLELFNAFDKFQILFTKYIVTENKFDQLIEFLQFVSTKKFITSANFDTIVFKYLTNSELDNKLLYLNKSIKFILDVSIHISFKVQLFKRIIYPILLHEDVTNGSMKNLCISNPTTKQFTEWFAILHTKLLVSPDMLQLNQVAGEIDYFRVELLQLTSILLIKCKSVLDTFRKDIIKFAWCFNKVEDSLTKHAAYVCCCYFFKAFRSPIKIRLSMLGTLLNDHNTETKSLTRQGLDLLAHVISFPEGESDTIQYDFSWMKTIKRQLAENFSGFRFIIKCKEPAFYGRENYIQICISAIGKLTMQQTNKEQGLLAIDIAELVLYWENMASKLQNDKSTLVVVKGIPDYQAAVNYKIPFGQKEGLITFLVRYICVNNTNVILDDVGRRALKVLKDFLSLEHWIDVEVKLSFFKKFLIEIDLDNKNNLCFCINSLEVLNVVLEKKNSNWIISNFDELLLLLDKSIKSDNHDIHVSLEKILKKIFKAIKQEYPNDDDDNDSIEDDTLPGNIIQFLRLLRTVITDDLGNTSSLAAGINLCWVVGLYKPGILNRILSNIIKTFNKVCRDYINITNKLLSEHKKLNEEATLTTILLEKLLFFGAMRISYLGDQRRSYLSIIAQLIDKSANYDLLNKVLSVIHKFIFEHTISPTNKEKAAILNKMMGFEHRKDLLLLSKKFYKIIIKIFEDEKLSFSELTQRLEQPFLVGTRFFDVGIRKRLMNILDASIEDNVQDRLDYFLKQQNWEYLANYPWLVQSTELLFNAFDLNEKVCLNNTEYIFTPLNNISVFNNNDNKIDEKSELIDGYDSLKVFIETHQKFLVNISSISSKEILTPLIEILRSKPNQINSTWSEIFPIIYKNSNSKFENCKMLINLLSKPDNLTQLNLRPNIIQGLLLGIEKCEDLNLPPYLLKYLSNTFNCHYITMDLIEKSIEKFNTYNVTEVSEDVLCDILSELGEWDYFYGRWRNRASIPLTKNALSYEQLGMFSQAQKCYESVQIEARKGMSKYAESEYNLWSNQWVFCSQRLQQWDLLTEIGKTDNSNELLLECIWREVALGNDKLVFEEKLNSLNKFPTLRSQFFKTFLSFYDNAQNNLNKNEFLTNLEVSIQSSLLKWVSLPKRPTESHKMLLHSFQLFVEINEAAKMIEILNQQPTNQIENVNKINNLFNEWKERMPNLYDNLTIWDDFSHQRLHFYALLATINKTFMSDPKLIKYINLGFHQHAFTINRFSRALRMQGMPEMCITQLAKVYKLPNIEIGEAFVKLSEQAKCCLEIPSELLGGYDILSNAKMDFFNASQQAELITLKAIFQYKMNSFEDAHKTFARATQIDKKLPKAWEEWGIFTYNYFKQLSLQFQLNNTKEIKLKMVAVAKSSIFYLLNAAGLYKSNKSRRCLSIILWYLAIDDKDCELIKQLKNYKSEIPIWYWISFLPQLLDGLSSREFEISKSILILIAKKFPQALQFQLKSLKDDYQIKLQLRLLQMKKEAAVAAAAAVINSSLDNTSTPTDTSKYLDGDIKIKEETVNVEKAKNEDESKTTENDVSLRQEIGENKESTEKRDTSELKESEKESAEKESAEKESAEKESAEKESAEKESAEKESTENESAEKESAEKESAEKESTENESAEKESAEKESAEKESTENESAEKESAEKESAEKESAEKEFDKKESVKESEKESTEKESAEKESEKESTDKKNTVDSEESKLIETKKSEVTQSEDDKKIKDSQNLVETKSEETKVKDEAKKPEENTTTAKPSESKTVPVTSQIPQIKEPLFFGYIEDILLVMKSSYPMLVLSVDLFIDQLNLNFVDDTDQEAYRLISMLSTEGIQAFGKIKSKEDLALVEKNIKNNIFKFANNILPEKYRAPFGKDLIKKEQDNVENDDDYSSDEYLEKIVKWKTRISEKIDRRNKFIDLEKISSRVAEFHHRLFYKIEVPGQYLLNKDSNDMFETISRFQPIVEDYRDHAICFKKFRIKSNVGNIIEFGLQVPSQKVKIQREEKTIQFFRLLNERIDENFDTNSRNIKFNFPIIVPLKAKTRLIKTEMNEISLEKIYEYHCNKHHKKNDDASIYFIKQYKEFITNYPSDTIDTNSFIQAKLNVLKTIENKIVSNDIIQQYFIKMFKNHEEYWYFKKQFISQYSTIIFMSYLVSIIGRLPDKIGIGKTTGNIWTKDIIVNRQTLPTVPGLEKESKLSESVNKFAPILHINEPVPFRFTPNIKKFIGDVGIEGILVSYIFIIARSLTSRNFDLDQYLELYIKDEVVNFFTPQARASIVGDILKEMIRINCLSIKSKAMKLASTNPVPFDGVRELLEIANNDKARAQSDIMWRPYF